MKGLRTEGARSTCNISSQSCRRVLTCIRWIVSSSSGGFMRVISFYRTTKSVRMS